MLLLFQITLRVKESEVQCLKQEITSLKDELQSAQRVSAAGVTRPKSWGVMRETVDSKQIVCLTEWFNPSHPF